MSGQVQTESTVGAPWLTVRSLAFSYPGRHLFVEWSADLGPGLTWLHGPNGSGKSTLLKLLAGALPALAGRWQLADGAVGGAGLDERQALAWRQRVFWCGPGPVAFDHLSPAEYLGFVQGLYPGFDVAALPQQVQGLGLAPFMGQRLRELSTGTQRKVWLAAALLAGAELTLLDEPLNALDETSAAHLRAQLALCAAQTTRAWLVASHERPLARPLPEWRLDTPPA